MSQALKDFFEQAETALVDGVVLPGGKVTITASARELYKRAAPTETLFIRGGAVQRVVDGQLEILKPPAARSVFEKYAQFWAWRVGRTSKKKGDQDGEAGEELVLKQVIMSSETAEAILACDARFMLPKINGLVGCPLVLEDGTIIGKGYDRTTGLFIRDGEMPPEVPLPTAIQLFDEALADFDFQSSGDRSRALASFITPALKLGGHIKRNVPTDVAEADHSQSGKTYRQRCVAAVYRENPSLVTQKRGGVGSVDETLDAQLIAGRPFIQWDNFRGKFDSPHTEALLTAEKTFTIRLPFRAHIEIDPSWFLLMLSSNGAESTRDFANRSSIVRNRKRWGFKFKEYEEGDLLDHIRANQPLYLGAVFAIVREWIRLGRPRTNEMRHDFREWAQALDWIVQRIFKGTALMEGHEAAQVRVSNPDLTFLRNLAFAVVEKNCLGQSLIASQLYDLAETSGIPIPGLREPDEDHGKRIIGLIMARLFKNGDTVMVDEFTVNRDEVIKAREDGGGFLVKRYVFSKWPILE